MSAVSTLTQTTMTTIARMTVMNTSVGNAEKACSRERFHDQAALTAMSMNSIGDRELSRDRRKEWIMRRE